MNELRKIYSRKILLLLAAVIIINAGLFMLSCSSEKQVTLTGQELENYISEYPRFLENTKSNSGNMSLLGMYKSGFAADNIVKSAKAYEKLHNVKAEYGDNRGVVILFGYGFTDIFLLAILMIVSIDFLRERKKGLVNLVRSTYNGRTALYLQRTAILAFSAFALGALLYGGNYLAMLIKFGGGGLSRAIQSLPEFKECPYSLSIGGYFLLSCLMKIAASFTISLAFFLLTSILGTAAAYTAAALLTAAEALLFYLIPPVSSFNALKFINIFSIMNCKDFLSVCRNLDIFGTAVPALNCCTVFMIISAGILFAAGCFIHGKMYVKKSKFIEGIINKLKSLLEKAAFQRTLFGWESFKLLLKQGGLFFMATAFVMTLSSSMKYKSFYSIDLEEKAYYEKYHGTITKETLTQSYAELHEIENTIIHYQKAIDELTAKDEKFFKSTSEQKRLQRLESSLNDAKHQKDAFMPVIEVIRSGYSYTKRTGREVELITPYSYDMLLNCDTQTVRHASLYILIGIIGAVSGIFAYDTQNNMKSSLRSSFRGRGKLLFVKTGLVFAVCAAICVSIHLIEFFQVKSLLGGFNDISSPVQSLMFMRDFKLNVSIAVYLIMLFAVRTMAAFFVGIICSVISKLCTDTTSAMGVCIFLLAVPAILAEVIPNADRFSFVYLISGEYFR